MKQVKRQNLYINMFDNITEFTDYLKRPRVSGRDNSSETGDKGFCGTSSFEEAMELLKYGDTDILDKVKKEQIKLKINKNISNVNTRKSYYNDFIGCIPNVPQYLLGVPQNMINTKIDRPSKRIVNIFLNIRVGAFTDADEIIEAGTKYLQVIDMLEKNGYRCNLYTGTANRYDFGDNYCYLLVRVKTDREPLNLKKICFSLANPSMQRRMKFKWMEVNDCSLDYTNDGYGGSDTKTHTIEVVKKELNKDFIVWTYEDSESSNIENVIKNLKKEGIEINGY